MAESKILYHGSKEIVRSPEIRIARYNKDFYTIQKADTPNKFSYCTGIGDTFFQNGLRSLR